MTQRLVKLARHLSSRFAGAMGREDGTATMEFVLVIPLIMMIFMASFESGLLMTRSIMLEQSVDMTMRELRLGHLPNITSAALKREICSRTIIFADCQAKIKIEMDRVSTTAFDIPVEPAKCVNRALNAVPVVDPDPNPMGNNDLMFVRVCVVLKAMFPATGLALDLKLDPNGGYALVARTAFSVEP